jgi:hypothetical protein
MTYLKRIAFAVSTLMTITGLAAVPVYATSGSNRTLETSNTSGSGTDSNRTSDSRETETPDQPEVESHTETEIKPEIKHKIETEVKSESRNMLEDLKKNRKEHTKEERKKNCLANENGMETRIASFGKNADKFQARIDAALAKAVAYHTSSAVVVTDWDALLAAATAAQSQSASSVSVLKGLKTNLDCNAVTVADDVAAVKIAASKARTDLLAYKASVKDMLKALEIAKEGTN